MEDDEERLRWEGGPRQGLDELEVTGGMEEDRMEGRSAALRCEEEVLSLRAEEERVIQLESGKRRRKTNREMMKRWRSSAARYDSARDEAFWILGHRAVAVVAAGRLLAAQRGRL